MSWATDNGWEDGTWSIISSETGFAHTGSIIYYEGSNIIVTHFELIFLALHRLNLHKKKFWFNSTKH
jgi:hypothetical protein